MRSKYLVLGALLVSPFVSAEPLTEVNWHVKEQLYRCSLTADLNYANLSLEIHAEPQAPLKLSVLSGGFERFSDATELSVNRAYWKRQSDKVYYPLDVEFISAREVMVSSDVDRLLEDLKAGYWVGLADGDFDIEFASLSLEMLSGEFEQCTSSMPLITFDDARDNSLYFETGKSDLQSTSNVSSLLDGIASVVVRDPDVAKVLVDGHTDSSGDEIDNLTLSSNRASSVAMELVNRGVPIEKIETRSHGQRYPDASNATSKGRNKNRRVQVRLIRKVQ